MLTYNDLYEYLRKEKYSEQLQNLPRDFIQQFSDYLTETRKKFSNIEVDEFSEELVKDKKIYTNAIAIFKELMLRRKKKILNLVFVAAETGIMKRDFSDMLLFEQELFERLVKAVNEADKSLDGLLNKKSPENKKKLIMLKEDIDEFVDTLGEIIGPFKKGVLVNVNAEVADILVTDERAIFVDDG